MGYFGVVGNKVADGLAKAALESCSVDVEVPQGRGEVKTLITEKVMDEWQRWDNE